MIRPVAILSSVWSRTEPPHRSNCAGQTVYLHIHKPAPFGTIGTLPCPLAGASSDPSAPVTIDILSQFDELRETASRLQRRSCHLVTRAMEACATSSRLEEASRTHREERRQWRSILARIPADPDHILVLCAYCHRARGALGWAVLPAGIEYEVKRWGGCRVSHGFCPDCVRRHWLD